MDNGIAVLIEGKLRSTNALWVITYHQIEIGETRETPSASTQVRLEAWSPQGPVVYA
jgi:hypothetical protein